MVPSRFPKGSATNELRLDLEIGIDTHDREQSEVACFLDSDFSFLIPRCDRLDLDQLISETSIGTFPMWVFVQFDPELSCGIEFPEKPVQQHVAARQLMAGPTKPQE